MLSFAPAFGLGVLGAFVVEILPILELRKKRRDQWPEWVTAPEYWGLAIVGFLIGGGLAGAYASEQGLKWYVAINVGAAWPAVITGIAKGTGQLTPDPNDVS